MAIKRYLDYEGLQTFWELAKEYINKKTESTIEIRPLYYELDENGEIKYHYNEARGTAEHGVTYYERTGSGTDVDPYVYIEVGESIMPGDPVDGLYVQGKPYTTTEPTEEELNYPVIDSETGEQKTEEVLIVDPETEKTIEAILEKKSIPTEGIMEIISEDLWGE